MADNQYFSCYKNENISAKLWINYILCYVFTKRIIAKLLLTTNLLSFCYRE